MEKSTGHVTQFLQINSMGEGSVIKETCVSYQPNAMIFLIKKLLKKTFLRYQISLNIDCVSDNVKKFVREDRINKFAKMTIIEYCSYLS